MIVAAFGYVGMIKFLFPQPSTKKSGRSSFGFPYGARPISFPASIALNPQCCVTASYIFVSPGYSVRCISGSISVYPMGTFVPMCLYTVSK